MKKKSLEGMVMLKEAVYSRRDQKHRLNTINQARWSVKNPYGYRVLTDQEQQPPPPNPVIFLSPSHSFIRPEAHPTPLFLDMVNQRSSQMSNLHAPSFIEISNYGYMPQCAQRLAETLLFSSAPSAHPAVHVLITFPFRPSSSRTSHTPTG